MQYLSTEHNGKTYGSLYFDTHGAKLGLIKVLKDDGVDELLAKQLAKSAKSIRPNGLRIIIETGKVEENL